MVGNNLLQCRIQLFLRNGKLSEGKGLGVDVLLDLGSFQSGDQEDIVHVITG